MQDDAWRRKFFKLPQLLSRRKAPLRSGCAWRNGRWCEAPMIPPSASRRHDGPGRNPTQRRFEIGTGRRVPPESGRKIRNLYFPGNLPPRSFRVRLQAAATTNLLPGAVAPGGADDFRMSRPGRPKSQTERWDSGGSRTRSHQTIPKAFSILCSVSGGRVARKWRNRRAAPRSLVSAAFR